MSNTELYPAPLREHHGRQKNKAISGQLLLWVTRILVSLDGHNELIKSQGFEQDFIAKALGLLVSGDDGDIEMPYDPGAARKALRQLHINAEAALPAPFSACLLRNLQRLALLVNLTSVDLKLLEFAIALQQSKLLGRCAHMLGDLTGGEAHHVLSVLLDQPCLEIRDALRGDAALARSGLLTLERSRCRLTSKFKLLSDAFIDLMTTVDADPLTAIRDRVRPCSPGELSLTDYPHMDCVLAILKPYLTNVIKSKRAGVNIFIYGAPGTGKTQFTKALAQDLAQELFEVSSGDEDDDPISGYARLQAFRAAQSFLRSGNALILFDEVEDLFDDGNAGSGNKSTAQIRKAWINRLLETNSVPTFWLSNSVSMLDAAFVRRFDMIIQIPVPPEALRKNLITKVSQGLIDDLTIKRIAESDTLAPAVVTRAASVIATIKDELGREHTANALCMLIDNTLDAQRHKKLRQAQSLLVGQDSYNPRFIQANVDLEEIAKRLSGTSSARICLYGPPGTGKTAYAHWLAKQLRVSIHIRRASDLLSKWVGGNEQNIADVFQTAQSDGAVLLIDEVDGFLQDRRNAEQSWGVSMVNEMLTQMETFTGIFIASTNSMGQLDPAALRRFDFKVKFDFLSREQVLKSLDYHCGVLAIPHQMSGDTAARLSRLKILTPGDFSVVARQHRFKPIANVAAFVHALEAECAFKNQVGSQIGFL